MELELQVHTGLLSGEGMGLQLSRGLSSQDRPLVLPHS